MTLKQALSCARVVLAANGIEDASLETEVLLRYILKVSRVQLYLGLEHEISPEQDEEFQRLIQRRLQHEPSAYITEHREFYGRDFYVDPSVLIPRPESELLVEKALELAENQAVATIVDVGTGCCAIAISLALNLRQVKIYASDISASALKVARFNCRQHGVADRISFLEGDMLDSLPEPADLIIANLPYVAEAELQRDDELNFEPSLALNGGPDGLDKIRRLSHQVNDWLRPGGSLFLEIGQGQGKAVTALLRRLFPAAGIEITPDLSGIDRVVSLSLSSSWQYTGQDRELSAGHGCVEQDENMPVGR